MSTMLLLSITIFITLLFCASSDDGAIVDMESHEEDANKVPYEYNDLRHLGQEETYNEGHNEQKALHLSDRRLQEAWWNWAICQKAIEVNTGCPSQAGVPSGYIFLAGLSDGNCSTIPVRTCNVNVNPRRWTRVFFPVINGVFYSSDNDNLDICPASDLRFDPNFWNRYKLSNAEYAMNPYARVNGRKLAMKYLITTQPFYFSDCPSPSTCEICDDCDDPVCTDCGGVDAYPSFGYYVEHAKKWRRGQTRVYEFGANFVFGSSNFCPSIKYILTAV